MNTATCEPLIVDLDKLARLLRLSRRWLRAEASAGRIPSILAGKRRLFNPDAVRAAIAAQAGASPNAEGGAR
jgi:hypothetical protein